MTNSSARTLILLRHAKSDWSGGEADIDRPLAESGLRQAPDAGGWLGMNVEPIQLALVSPAERARVTWELASSELEDLPEVRVEERVYAASAGQLLEVVRELPDELDTVVLVGHNPGMEDLASVLAGRPILLRTAGIAVIGVTGSWSELDTSTAVLEVSGRSNGTELV
ncbi:MAG: histidine phosphatase family protein [Leifsonia sp.]